MCQDSPSCQDIFVYSIRGVEGVVLQLRWPDRGQARTANQVVKEWVFDGLLITMRAVTDRVLHNLPGGLIP